MWIIIAIYLWNYNRLLSILIEVIAEKNLEKKIERSITYKNIKFLQLFRIEKLRKFLFK